MERKESTEKSTAIGEKPGQRRSRPSFEEEIRARCWRKETSGTQQEQEVLDTDMYQNLITPAMLKHAFAKARDYPADDFTEQLNHWLVQIEPLVQAINKLNERVDLTNKGCKICQKYFKEELAKCRTIKSADTAEK